MATQGIDTDAHMAENNHNNFERTLQNSRDNYVAELTHCLEVC